MVFSIKKFRRNVVCKPGIICGETGGGEIHPPERTVYVRNGFVIDEDEKTCRSVALRKIDGPTYNHALLYFIDIAECAALLGQLREQLGNQRPIHMSAHSYLFFIVLRLLFVLRLFSSR